MCSDTQNGNIGGKGKKSRVKGCRDVPSPPGYIYTPFKVRSKSPTSDSIKRKRPLLRLGSKADRRQASIRKVDVVNRSARQDRLSSELIRAGRIVLGREVEGAFLIVPVGTCGRGNIVQFVVVSRPVVSGREARRNLIHGVGRSKGELASAVENVAALRHIDPFV